MIHFYPCRLYPNSEQESRLFHYLDVTRRVYNFLLEQKISAYKHDKTSLTRFDMINDIRDLRYVMPTLQDLPSQVLSTSSAAKIDLAFKSFFRRLKSGQAPGFPKFKSRNRWNSFGYCVASRVIVNGKIKIPKIDQPIRCRGLRAEMVGVQRSVRVVFRAGRWFCIIQTEDGLKAPPKRHVISSVGVDVGLNKFASMSDGSVIENPRFGSRMARKIAHVQRKLMRQKKKGTRNRWKTIKKLQRLYLRASDMRSTFTHTEARKLVELHELIVVEDLNVSGMAKGRFAKSILDAAWSQFVTRLEFKANKFGSEVVKVDPSGTSQECSGCRNVVKKSLGVRIHRCPTCGLILDRDHNAAINILLRATEPAPGVPEA